MVYDYSKILGKIREKCTTQIEFAKALGVSERTCSLKLNNRIEWKQSEIINTCKILNISEEEIPEYFFKLKVQNN